jgi:hypothetical protein
VPERANAVPEKHGLFSFNRIVTNSTPIITAQTTLRNLPANRPDSKRPYNAYTVCAEAEKFRAPGART